MCNSLCGVPVALSKTELEEAMDKKVAMMFLAGKDGRTLYAEELKGEIEKILERLSAF